MRIRSGLLGGRHSGRRQRQQQLCWTPWQGAAAEVQMFGSSHLCHRRLPERLQAEREQCGEWCLLAGSPRGLTPLASHQKSLTMVREQQQSR